MSGEERPERAAPEAMDSGDTAAAEIVVYLEGTLSLELRGQPGLRELLESEPGWTVAVASEPALSLRADIYVLGENWGGAIGVAYDAVVGAGFVLVGTESERKFSPLRLEPAAVTVVDKLEKNQILAAVRAIAAELRRQRSVSGGTSAAGAAWESRQAMDLADVVEASEIIRQVTRTLTDLVVRLEEDFTNGVFEDGSGEASELRILTHVVLPTLGDAERAAQALEKATSLQDAGYAHGRLDADYGALTGARQATNDEEAKFQIGKVVDALVKISTPARFVYDIVKDQLHQ